MVTQGSARRSLKYQRHTTLAIGGLALCVIVLSTAPGICQKTIAVPGDVATLQAAVALAESGDVVQLAPGTYMAGVALRRGLTIRGDTAQPERTVLVGDKTGEQALDVYPSGDSAPVRLEGVTVEGPEAEFGVVCSGSLEMRACVIRGNRIGVVLTEAGRAVVAECRFLENGEYAIAVFDSAHGDVMQCDFSVQHGVQAVWAAGRGASVDVQESTFVGQNVSQVLDRSNGVHAVDGASASVASSSFRWFEDAIQTQGGTSLTVANNAISSCCSGVTVWNEETDATAVLILGNEIRECHVGVSMTGAVGAAEISCNVIHDCIRPVAVGSGVCGTYVDGCPFSGVVTGVGNRFYSNEQPLCPRSLIQSEGAENRSCD